MKEEKKIIREELKVEREGVLEQLENWLETPMLILSVVWLALFVYELLWNLSPFLEGVGIIIWIVFILDFTLKIFLAPKTLAYLKDNWLIAISLLLPALRVFRIFSIFRVLGAARAAR